MHKATTHRTAMTIIVLLRLNTLLKAIGLLIAKYLSILIAVMVKTEAATATPEEWRINYTSHYAWN